MKYKIIGTAVIAVAVVLAFCVRPETAQAHSSGFSDGYSKAKNDVMNGDSHDDGCGFENSDAYCFDFKAGYAAGWAAGTLLH